MRAWLALVGCAAFALGAPPVAADSGPGATPDNPENAVTTTTVDQRIIVQWEPGVARGDRVQARSDAGATDSVDLGSKRFQLLTLAEDQSATDAIESLRADPNVVLATRDGYSQLHATQPNDPLFGQLWGLHNTGAGIQGFVGSVPGADIDALAAWDKTTGDSSVIVADLDSGYRNAHPDLSGPLWTNPGDPADGVDNDGNGVVDDTRGVDFVGANADAIVFDGDATDDLYAGGHGVHTAGTIAAQGNNGVGITGVAQKATILPIRVCGWSPSINSGAGGITCKFSSQIAGINYAGAHGARVANMSIGGPDFDPAVRNAMALNPNTLFVISAGNDSKNNETSATYPCSWDPSTSGIGGAVDNVVCVAATDQADQIASFSNWGKTRVDLAAPGTEVLSAFPVRTSRFSQDFESTGWPYGWTAGDFTRVNGAPLTSFGITNDTVTQPNGTTRTAITPGVTVAGPTECRLVQRRTVNVSGSDTYNYRIFVDGTQVVSLNRTTSGYVGTNFQVPAGSHAVTARFSYARDGGIASNGVWLDDISFWCATAVGAENANDYDYLEGTSMAAPHVSGAATLLAAYEPAATVTQLRQALLTSVDPIADLNPSTGTHPVSSGGRLDADAALAKVDSLVAPNTMLTQQTTSLATATFGFAATETRAPATFECSLDGGGFTSCSSPVNLTGVPAGPHTYAVRARDSFGNVDASPAAASWTASIAPVASAPSRVTGVKVKRKAKSAKVTWKPAAGADSYRIRWTKGGKKYGTWVTTSGLGKTIKKLSPTKRYKVQLVAVNGAGSSAAVTVKIKKAR